MRRLLFVLFSVIWFCSCGSRDNGELIGVQGRENWFEPDPYGMAFIPMGSYNMGPNDQDVPFAINSQTKTVSVDAFWMDETEITNNEYRQFVHWIRDSIARRILVRDGLEEYKLKVKDNGDEEAKADADDPEKAFLDWDKKIKWNDQKVLEALNKEEYEFFRKKEDRIFRKKEVNTERLVYRYQWFDLRQAAKKINRFEWNYDFKSEKYTYKYKGFVFTPDGKKNNVTKRKDFIFDGAIPVYPDTLVWMADYTYSYNEPWTRQYFWHPAFDEYPVVGVTWVQANAFCIWRTQLLNNHLLRQKQNPVQDYRLPTEAEWEYAARGSLALSMYPWGGPYTRNNLGCFIANFKPLRGNYCDDGGIRTLPVGSYEPNEYGLFDMAGNVSEWTSNAYDESAYSFTHDLNPDYTYNAVPDDPPALKRKVIRGGSWKDVSYYLQCGSRAYEYQDTAKSYIGFRCVRSFLGGAAGDWKGGKH